ncbi:response regulator transcription factor [Paenibacillus macquariensis]|uniref:Two-component system, OmpR family, response regulator RegX3 n=1 Tax=Paenibacillus macquariensis TaxID=948756 RepID=A0ABY1K5W0_9BACL|nr:response regulator transcription factor [Paenibacillus macquariensis]MEC0090490.1 response regulator transcription factor [Paenibacillus macquariensis]OAB38492.1 DNA-binding response regulator [Paenibacillus macquariensis subsp. macquariensis]SIR30060.1 two-component system, OmpR family, response regulator RegX3 [Paenibacillus macquariensis]
MNFDCLIVDDEIVLAETTSEYFNMFEVKSAYVTSADGCEQFLRDNETSLILLDINLGDTSGFDLCKRLRQTTQIPILFISARSSDDDILIALNIGGDDYIQKPYTLSILLAKVKAVLKRYGNNSSTEMLEFGQVKIDCMLCRVRVNGVDIKLKALEYKLLCYLAKNKNRVVTKEELFQNVWGDSFTGDGTLNVHIRHLREKIEVNPNEPQYITTVWGTGYVLEDGRI